MPIQISVMDALDKELDHLLPEEFKAFIAGIEERPEDEGRWGVFADWLHEHGEPDLEFALRWCLARHMVPIHDRAAWRWGQTWTDDAKRFPRAMPPEDWKYVLDENRSRSFMGLMAKTAKQLLERQEKLFGIKPTTAPPPAEDDSEEEDTPLAASVEASA